MYQMPRSRGEEKASSVGVFPAILFFVFLLDQLTKFLAFRLLSGTDTLPVIPNFFHLTLVHNTGIAFGFFRQHPEILLILITISLVFLFIWGWKNTELPKFQRHALAMILGGAVGNWLDRVRFGAVIDFLDFRIWPVFNIADSAITIGVTLFAFSVLFKKSS
jgi:signal peptidase II